MKQEARFERKFKPEGIDIERLILQVKLHPYGFKEAYPSRKVNNVYFDTAGLDFYRNHIDGNEKRKKVRVRWYGEEASLSPALEFKTRIGMVGEKELWRLTDLDVQLWRKKGTSLNDLRIDMETMSRIKGLIPVLENSYIRRYYISYDSKFRITIDDCIKVGRTGSGKTVSLPVNVMELKYGVADEDAASIVSSCLPFRLEKFSKYVVGIQTLEMFTDYSLV